MSQSNEAAKQTAQAHSSGDGTPTRVATQNQMENELESGERLSTRDTTDKIDSRGKLAQESAACLHAEGLIRSPAAVGLDGHPVDAVDGAMAEESAGHDEAQATDQMLKDDEGNTFVKQVSEGTGSLDAQDVQVSIKKRPGRPPLKRDPETHRTSAKHKSAVQSGHLSSKQTKAKRAGHGREPAYETSFMRKQPQLAPTRGRKDYMTYEEMVASVNLLRYLDWDKLNPKSHQNSPCKLGSDLVNNPPLVPIALWFMICSQYFPRMSREQLSFAQQVVNKLPDFGIGLNSQAILAGPGMNPYFPIFCISKVVETLSTPGPTTLIAPIHHILSKQHKSNTHTETGTLSKKASRSNPNQQRNLLTTSLQAFLEDKKNEKRFRLQYTLADDMFLSQLRAVSLRLKKTGSEHSEMTGLVEEKVKTSKQLDHTHLDQVIKNLEDELAEVSQTTQNNIKALHRRIEADRNNQLFFEGSFKPEHLLQDLHSVFKDEMMFLDIMEYKQQNQVTCSILDSQERRNKFSFPDKERPKKSEDYVCQICSDGDYSDENQIVFCARCNISFHQRCYGIPQIPEGNWICDLCKYHGPEGRLVRCALCTRRGGCLRRTYLPANDEFWKLRNKAYWEFATSGDPVDPSEPPVLYTKDGQTSLIEDNVSVNSQNFEEFLFYDYYQELDKLRYGDETREPRTHLSWVHLSCCIWMSDLEITLEPAPNKVKNIENLDKVRFNLECGICGKKEGACIQCHNRNCTESFHVECARRTKMFMEARNSENRFYTIYCEKHAPLEAKRKLESNTANNCNLITKFCRHTEKLFDSYRPRCVERPTDEETPQYIRQLKKRIAEKNSAGRQASRGDDDLFSNPFIKKVRFEVQKYPEYGNVIEIKLEPETGECLSASYTPPTSSIWKDLICKTHPVWEQISKVHDWYQPLVYKKYKRIMNGSDELPFDHLVKVKIPRSQRNKRRNADYDSDEISYLGDEGVYFIQNTESSMWLM